MIFTVEGVDKKPTTIKGMISMTKTDINQDVYTITVPDYETGELVPAKVVLQPEAYDVISKERKKQKKDYAEQKNRKGMYNKIADGFTFSYIQKVSDLYFDDRFSDDEKTRIMFLGTYVSYSNKGSFLVFPNGRYIRKHHLKNILEITNNKKFYRFYNKMLDVGIITEIKEDDTEPPKLKLKWSEEYHFKGKSTNSNSCGKSYLKTYDKQIRDLYTAKNENGKPINSPKQLYTVFMLLPFVHYETNVICKYPDKHFADCEPMTIDELAKGLNFNRSNDLKRKLLKIELKEQPVFRFDATNKATHITVNPFIVWRQNKMPETALLVSFYDTAKRIGEAKGIRLEMKDLLQID